MNGHTTTPLRSRLTEMADRSPFRVGWRFLDLRDGSSVDHDATRPVPAAGTARLVLYLACLRAAAAGTVDLTAQVRYDERHRDGHDSGILRWMSPGLTISLRDALAQTVITGDGVAAAMVCEALDSPTAAELMTEFCATTGLTATRPGTGSGPDLMAGGTTSPADLVTLVSSLLATAQGRTPTVDLGFDAGVAAEALQLMSSVLRTDGIAAHLPGHGPFLAEVAHLTCDGGSGDRPSTALADVGVVYQDDAPSYLLAVSCTDVPAVVDGVPGRTVALEAIGELSAVCWNRADG